MNDLRSLLIRHEGMKLRPYQCSAGKITIGVGRNLEDVGISEQEALLLLDNDIASVRRQAASFPWFSDLDEDRQNVVLSMLFNIGLTRFLGFKNMIAAIEKHDYNAAADQMLASKWASQVGRRAVELAQIMRSGAPV